MNNTPNFPSNGHNSGPAPDDETLLPDPQVCARYRVTPMTLWRWDRTPDLGFPKPIRIKTRKYRKLGELRAFDARQAAAGKAA